MGVQRNCKTPAQYVNGALTNFKDAILYTRNQYSKGLPSASVLLQLYTMSSSRQITQLIH